MLFSLSGLQPVQRLGVVAEDEWDAVQAARLLKARWSEPNALIGHAAGDKRVPVLARGHPQHGSSAVTGIPPDIGAGGGDPDDRSWKALIGDDQVGAAAKDQDWLIRGFGAVDRVDDLLRAARLVEGASRPAEAQRGAASEPYLGKACGVRLMRHAGAATRSTTARPRRWSA